MNDKDVLGMPDRLETKTTAEACRRYARNRYRVEQEVHRGHARRWAPVKEAE